MLSPSNALSNPISVKHRLHVWRQEMVSLRQLDMDLLCKFWALNEKLQEYKAQQSRNSSLSPHDWLEQVHTQY